MHDDTRMHSFFFFNDTATTEIYTLSLHDALPISRVRRSTRSVARIMRPERPLHRSRSLYPSPIGSVPNADRQATRVDRKSTRLNSSHANISYAVFCLKKKKNCALLFSSIKQFSTL